MGTIAGFAVKPVSSKHLCKYLKVLETVFSIQIDWLRPSKNCKNKDFSTTIPQGQGQRQGLEIGP